MYFLLLQCMVMVRKKMMMRRKTEAFMIHLVNVDLDILKQIIYSRAKKWRSKERLDAPSICKCNVNVM